jgi:hypothetical protein
MYGRPCGRGYAKRAKRGILPERGQSRPSDPYRRVRGVRVESKSMCGRITRHESPRGDRQGIRRDSVRGGGTGIRTTTLPRVRSSRPSSPCDGEKRLGPMRWGYVSPTATEPKLAPVNVRAETSWSGAFRVGCATATPRSKACCDDGERLVMSSGARWFTHARLRSRAFRNRTLRGACSICRNLGEVNDELGAALRLGRLRNGAAPTSRAEFRRGR